MDRSRDWATRIVHEASLHEANAFLTLTFNDDNLPSDYSVRVEDVQRFMKRLRKALAPTRVRFFACGEYGDANQRPHYHIMIFGYDFPDKQPWRKTGSGFVVHRSPLLDKCWGFGHAEIGTVTVQSAGYVSRYILKKIGGDPADAHYTRTHPLTGEVNRVRPEFIVMSTNPGLGRGWYDKYQGDAFPSDFVVIEGEKRSIPRYYSKQLKDASENDARKIKWSRMRNAAKHADNNTPDRLAVREELQHIRAEKLVRDLETDQ